MKAAGSGWKHPKERNSTVPRSNNNRPRTPTPNPSRNETAGTVGHTSRPKARIDPAGVRKGESPADAPMVAVDYYPEHWTPERVPTDLDLMRDAGVRAIRLAEFAWSRMEPTEGHYDFAWLDRVISQAAERGIRTIMCTPTATPPAWLCAKHPDIMGVEHDGRTKAFGHRRQYDPASPVYRRYAEGITRAVGEHFKDTDAVFAWQIDNELFGNSPSYSASMRHAFQEWLRKEYSDISELNRRWGTAFWSQEYTDFTQIPLPAGDPGFSNGEAAHHPSLQLAFRRFRSQLWRDFTVSQKEILRGIKPSWIITTNAYLFLWGDAIDYAELFADLDVYAFDNYSRTLDEGAFYNNLAASITPHYWTLEQRSSSPRAQHLWPAPQPGMEELFTQTIDHGADLVSFFRFRQCRFGHEQDHGAVIPHDGRPGRHYEILTRCSSYANAAGSRAEDRGGAAGTHLAHAPAAAGEPDHGRFLAAAPVLIHYAWQDSWVRQIAGWSDYIAFIQDTVHAGLREGLRPIEASGKPVPEPRIRFVFPERLKRRAADQHSTTAAPDLLPAETRLFVIPLAVVHYPELVRAARSFAERGGTVLCTPDLGRKDMHSVYHEWTLSPEWEELLGIRIKRHIEIDDAAVRRSGAQAIRTEGGHSACTRVDELTAISADVADRFASGPVPGAPALTVTRLGQGELRYAAGLFDRSFWRAAAIRHAR